jgi:hypothetical protein
VLIFDQAGSVGLGLGLKLGVRHGTVRVSPLGRGVVGLEIRALWGEGCDPLGRLDPDGAPLFFWRAAISKGKDDGAATVALISLRLAVSGILVDPSKWLCHTSREHGGGKKL